LSNRRPCGAREIISDLWHGAFVDDLLCHGVLLFEWSGTEGAGKILSHKKYPRRSREIFIRNDIIPGEAEKYLSGTKISTLTRSNDFSRPKAGPVQAANAGI